MPNAAPSMVVKFYGTRGSIPVCSKDFLEFGGNTSCVAIDLPDKNVLNIIDAGSGIRTLGQELMAEGAKFPEEMTIGFTHFHWDHIQGFPFFPPAYMSDLKINLLMMGRNSDFDRLKKILFDQMGGAFFPIAMGDMGANFNFISMKHKVTQNSTGMSVVARVHSHPGGALSYRIERNGKVLVISTDIEHGETIDQRIVELARDADLLIHEAQYTTEELVGKEGWGHSSYRQAIQVAQMANVKQLIMTHHDPSHNDYFLARKEIECQKVFPNSLLAREGMVIEL
ncbi:MAG: MBL fold metallo-hydrolase [Bacteroidia bacterium]|nr:MBL fold metallo-hydrolase [Bacteroidia bacterium]